MVRYGIAFVFHRITADRKTERSIYPLILTLIIIDMTFSLREHYKTLHNKVFPDERKYECGMCEYTTGVETNLKAHRSAKHKQGEQCDACEFVAATKSKLEQHRSLHGRSGAYSFHVMHSQILPFPVPIFLAIYWKSKNFFYLFLPLCLFSLSLFHIKHFFVNFYSFSFP